MDYSAEKVREGPGKGFLETAQQMAMAVQPGHAALSSAHYHVPSMSVTQGSAAMVPLPVWPPSTTRMSLGDLIASKAGMSSASSMGTLNLPSPEWTATSSLNTSFASIGMLVDVWEAAQEPSCDS